MASFRETFVRSLPFALDEFQIEALDVLDAGNSVLVAAPTGSGKTLVAEYAVARALFEGGRAFYTTPLKALSNQKFRDFAAIYGPDHVGLLTGDISRNGDAPVVVMTTEVLRNMIYSDRHGLSGLACVVLDEVHYLEDRYRGSVWEEIILSAPASVTLVCLSATVSNAEELASWIANVRGATGAVIEDHRPIALENLYVVGDRSTRTLLLLPTFIDGLPNKEATAMDTRKAPPRPTRRGGYGGGPVPARRVSALYRPQRSEIAERFSTEGLLPAIYFVFSRAGCEEGVRQCLDSGVRLTTPAERREIREIVDNYVEELSDNDLRVLGYARFVAGLEAGFAPHHAGMVPAFREAVEELFSKALVKLVFATETLALGINMPARSVIIESLSKYGGAGHQDLTPGEYTQLTGRAGRRGIDTVGYAAVLYSPLHSFSDVAALASARTRALRSSFRPTYNMAVNLVRRYSRDDADRLVRSSFAQYLSEVPLTRQLDAVIGVLEERGYLAGWRTTESGDRLAGIYHNCDLLICEAIGHGLFSGLDAPGVAALASVFTFEARRADEVGELPTSRLARRFEEVAQLAVDVRLTEAKASLPRTREPDAGFANLAYQWAQGSELRDLLTPSPEYRDRSRAKRRPIRNSAMSGGDFVRNVKQLVDLLRQIGNVAGEAALAKTARRAADDLVRGVVAASSGLAGDASVEVGDDPHPSGTSPVVSSGHAALHNRDL